mgnify:CR=1 FL=1
MFLLIQKWHKKFGVFAALFVICLVISGVAINHSEQLELNKKFIKTLTEKLLKWTGERWIISLTKESGEKSIYEKNME